MFENGSVRGRDITRMTVAPSTK